MEEWSLVLQKYQMNETLPLQISIGSLSPICELLSLRLTESERQIKVTNHTALTFGG